MDTLSAKRRSELRGEAHALNPTVLIGDKGLTDEVIAEIDRALRAHELIKVRAGGADRDVREVWLDTICTRLEAHAVQQIGKVFVIYRENPDPVPEPAKAAAGDEAKRRPRAEVVSQRGKQRQRSRDQDKRRERDIVDMVSRGKIPASVRLAPGPMPRSGARADESKRGARGEESKRGDEQVKRTSRPRSRTPSPLPASGPRRRRPRTSR